MVEKNDAVCSVWVGGGRRLGGRGLTLSGRGAESWASLSAQLSPPLLCLFSTIINTPFRCHVVIFT